MKGCFYLINKVAEARLFLSLVQKHPYNQLIIDYLINTSILKIVPNALILILENYLKKDPSHLPYIWRLVTIYSSTSNITGMKRALKLFKKTNDEYSYISECFAIPALYLNLMIKFKHNEKWNIRCFNVQFN